MIVSNILFFLFANVKSGSSILRSLFTFTLGLTTLDFIEFKKIANVFLFPIVVSLLAPVAMLIYLYLGEFEIMHVTNLYFENTNSISGLNSSQTKIAFIIGYLYKILMLYITLKLISVETDLILVGVLFSFIIMLQSRIDVNYFGTKIFQSHTILVCYLMTLGLIALWLLRISTKKDSQKY